MYRVVPVCMYRFWSACIGSGLHVSVLVCMYRFWSACIHSSLQFQSACISSALPVSVLLCPYRFCSAHISSALPILVLLCLYPFQFAVPVCMYGSSLCFQFQFACTGFSPCIISQSKSCPV